MSRECTGSEQREGITEFKNKNMENNIKGFLQQNDSGTSEEEEIEESPA